MPRYVLRQDRDQVKNNDSRDGTDLDVEGIMCPFLLISCCSQQSKWVSRKIASTHTPWFIDVGRGVQEGEDFDRREWGTNFLTLPNPGRSRDMASKLWRWWSSGDRQIGRVPQPRPAFTAPGRKRS